MSEPWPLPDSDAAELMDKAVRIQRGHLMAARPAVIYPNPTTQGEASPLGTTRDRVLLAGVEPATYPNPRRDRRKRKEKRPMIDLTQHQERFGCDPLPPIGDGVMPAGEAHGERVDSAACYCGWLDYFSCPDWLAQFRDEPAVD